MSKRANTQFSLVRTAIEQLGPALVPIAGGVAGLSSAVVGFGAAGAAAFFDVKQQIKDGTREGQAYIAMWGNLKTTLQTLIRGQAGQAIAPLNRSVTELMTQLPTFNGLISVSTRNLSDIATHGIDAIVGGLRTFTPLIEQAEGYVVKLTAAFDDWINGPGGAHFAQTLSAELEHLIPLLEQLGTLAVHFLSALTLPGNATIQFFTTFAGALNHIPVGLLKAATVAYIAFRAAVTVTAGIEAARKALLGLAAAQSVEAAAATRAAAANAEGAAAGGLRAGVAGVLGKIAPIAAAYVGVTLAANAAASATENWQHSTVAAQNIISNTLKGFSSILTGNLGGLKQAYANVSEGAQNAAKKAQAQSDVNRIMATSYLELAKARGLDQTQMNAEKYNIASYSAAYLNYQNTLAKVNSLQKQRADDNRKYGWDSPQAQEDSAKLKSATSDLNNYMKQMNGLKAAADATRKTINEQTAAIAAQRRTVNQTRNAYVAPIQRSNAAALTTTTAATPQLSQATAALSTYTQNVTKAEQAEASWTKVTDDNTVKVGQNVYEMKAYLAALQATNGDKAKAVGLLLGHTAAQAADAAAVKAAVAQQQIINTAISDASTKYHLTTDQIDMYAGALGITSQKLLSSIPLQLNFTKAIGAVKDSIDNGNTSMQAWVAAVAQFNAGTNTAASRAQLMGQAMLSLQGDNLSYANTMVAAASANKQLIMDFQDVGKGVINLKRGFIDYHNAGAAPVLNDLAALQQAAMQAATATYQHEVGLIGEKKAAADAAAVFKNDTHGALVDQAKQLGLTKTQADKLADRYFKWPKSATTAIKQLGGETVQGTLDKILRTLQRMGGFTVTPTVGLNDQASDKIFSIQREMLNLNGMTSTVTVKYSSQGIQVGKQGQGPHATAAGSSAVYGQRTIPPNTWFTVGEGASNTWEGGYADAAGRVQIWSNSDSKAMGFPSPAPTRYDVGTARESGGFTGTQGIQSPAKAQAAKAAADKAAAQAKADAAALTAWFKAIGPAARALNRDIAKLDTGKEIVKFAHSSTQYIQSQTQKYLRTLWDLQNEKAVPSKLVKQFIADTKTLNADLKVRDAQAAKLKAWRDKFTADKTAKAQYASQVSGGFQSAFDIGTSGNGYAYGIAASLKTAVANTQKETSLIAKAKKLKLDGRLVAQFLSEGPQGEANLEAIVNAGAGYVKGINADYSKLVTTSNALGATAAADKYNATLAADTKKIAAYTASTAKAQHQVTVDMNHISKVLDRVEKALKDAEVAKRKKGK